MHAVFSSSFLSILGLFSTENQSLSSTMLDSVAYHDIKSCSLPSRPLQGDTVWWNFLVFKNIRTGFEHMCFHSPSAVENHQCSGKNTVVRSEDVVSYLSSMLTSSVNLDNSLSLFWPEFPLTLWGLVSTSAKWGSYLSYRNFVRIKWEKMCEVILKKAKRSIPIK